MELVSRNGPIVNPAAETRCCHFITPGKLWWGKYGGKDPPNSIRCKEPVCAVSISSCIHEHIVYNQLCKNHTQLYAEVIDKEEMLCGYCWEHPERKHECYVKIWKVITPDEYLSGSQV